MFGAKYQRKKIHEDLVSENGLCAMCNRRSKGKILTKSPSNKTHIKQHVL